MTAIKEMWDQYRTEDNCPPPPGLYYAERWLKGCSGEARDHAEIIAAEVEHLRHVERTRDAQVEKLTAERDDLARKLLTAEQRASQMERAGQRQAATIAELRGLCIRAIDHIEPGDARSDCIRAYEAASRGGK